MYLYLCKFNELGARIWRKGTTHALLRGLYTGAASLENSTEVPQEIGSSIPYDPAVASGYMSKGNEITTVKRHLHPRVTAALLTMARMWKQPKCLLADE